LLTVFHIMYIFTLSGRTNTVMNVISEILVFTTSWIKLLVKLTKFPTHSTTFDYSRRENW
jgi:hypothetical protein